MCNGFCILWGSDNGIRLNVLTASYFDPLSPLYFDTFDKQLGFMQNLWILTCWILVSCSSNLAASNHFTCALSLRPVVVFAHELELTKMTAWNKKLSAMHVLAMKFAFNDIHRVSMFVCVHILHCFHSIENQGVHDVGLHLCLRWRSCHWRGLWDYDLQTKLEHHRQIPTNWIGYRNANFPPLYARSNVMMVD